MYALPFSDQSNSTGGVRTRSTAGSFGPTDSLSSCNSLKFDSNWEVGVIAEVFPDVVFPELSGEYGAVTGCTGERLSVSVGGATDLLDRL